MANKSGFLATAIFSTKLRVKYNSFNGRINYKLYWGRIDDQVCEVCGNHTRYKGIKPNIEYMDRMGWIDSQVCEVCENHTRHKESDSLS